MECQPPKDGAAAPRQTTEGKPTDPPIFDIDQEINYSDPDDPTLRPSSEFRESDIYDLEKRDPQGCPSVKRRRRSKSPSPAEIFEFFKSEMRMMKSPSARTPEGRKRLDDRIKEYFYNSEEEREIDEEVRRFDAELDANFERSRR